MIFLQGSFKSELPPTARSNLSRARSEEFITKQSIACQLNKDGCTDEFKTFLNGLCEWIYYDEDDIEQDESDIDDDENEEEDDEEMD